MCVLTTCPEDYSPIHLPWVVWDTGDLLLQTPAGFAVSAPTFASCDLHLPVGLASRLSSPPAPLCWPPCCWMDCLDFPPDLPFHAPNSWLCRPIWTSSRLSGWGWPEDQEILISHWLVPAPHKSLKGNSCTEQNKLSEFFPCWALGPDPGEELRWAWLDHEEEAFYLKLDQPMWPGTNAGPTNAAHARILDHSSSIWGIGKHTFYLSCLFHDGPGQSINHHHGWYIKRWLTLDW